LDGAFEGRGDDGEVVAFLLVSNEFVHDFGENACILHALLTEIGVTANSVIQIKLRLSMTGQVNISIGRNGQIDRIRHYFLRQVPIYLVDLDSCPDVDGLDVGKGLVLGESLIDLLVLGDAGVEIL
jgi:hypothetical protein